MGPPLRGIFYAQFDDAVGPQFLHVVPSDALSESLTQRLSPYVFPNLDLCGSLLTIRGIVSLKVMTCPQKVDSPRYPRHRFLFSFGLIFGQDDDVGPYGPVLKKIAHFFHKLEEESQFLSQGGKLGQLLVRIMEDLVARGECIVRVSDPTTVLALKLFPKPLNPPNVGDFQVPVLIRSLKNMMLKDWDLTIQKLEQHIDGRKFVKRIAFDASMDISLVKAALSQLLYYRVIDMLDVFQYSNLYTVTRHLSKLCENEALQKECRIQVLKDPSLSHKGMTSFSKIFGLYASLHPNAPFGDFCIEHNTEALGIDDQMFITFGLQKGILRRVREIPVPIGDLPLSTNPIQTGGDTQSDIVRQLINGENSYDEICGITTFSTAEVNLMVENMDDVVIIKI